MGPGKFCMKKRWEARRGVCQPFKAAAQRGGLGREGGELMGRPTLPVAPPGPGRGDQLHPRPLHPRQCGHRGSGRMELTPS